MEAVAPGRPRQSQQEPRLELLVADDDAELRSIVAARAGERIEALAVLEAADGAEALRIGLQHRPQIALLDVSMPRLGGLEAALTLRELRPQMRLALQTGDPLAHRERAREHHLPLFDKLELDRAIRWLESQAHACAGNRVRRPATTGTIDLECAACGYGVARSVPPPQRCPMCQSDRGWVYGPWRPFSSRALPRGPRGDVLRRSATAG